ncbi:MAG: thioredoxin [Flavobacteriia bacterium]|nr:MAG: thioredoxin [Flavobacteriia bacterium]
MLYWILLAILGLGIIYIIYAVWRFKNAPSVDDHEKIVVLTDADFQKTIKNKTILIDFWAAWCMPCKMMAPVLNDLAAELPDDKYVGKINIEQYKVMAQKYGVRNIPTLILFKNGEEVDRFVGIKSKSFLKSKMS